MIRYFLEHKSTNDGWVKSCNDLENREGFADVNEAYHRAAYWTLHGSLGIYRVVEKEIQ